MLAAPASIWVCPHDGAPLRWTPDRLECQACRRLFPIREQIPCFTAFEQLDPRQQLEHGHRDRTIDLPNDRRLRYDRQVELEAVVRRLPQAVTCRQGGLVLDAGCGVGRGVYRLLALGCDVCALDFSVERLRHLKRGAPAGGSLALAAADVSRIPLPEGACAAIINMQVLEHLPTATARRQLLAGFKRLLRPRGELILTVYNYNEPWRRRGQPVEGVHESGIFYHCYRPDELREELRAAELDVLEVCGIVHLLPHTYRLLPRLGRVGRGLDHGFEAHPRLGERWGHLLLGHARCPADG